MNAVSKSLFRREKNASDVSDQPMWRLGMSCATSWSWGLSIVLGILFLRLYGLIPALLWIGGNICAVPLLGAFRRFVPTSARLLDFRATYAVFIFAEFVAITLNLKALQTALQGNSVIKVISFFPDGLSAALVALITLAGVGIVWFVNRYGFRGSVLTDLGQYPVQLIGAAALALFAFSIGDRADIQLFVAGGYEWMWLAFLGIISGAFPSANLWQRLEAAGQAQAFRVSLWSAFFFGIYMFFVVLAGLYFTEHIFLSGLLIFILVVMATSTLDSSAAALQFIAERLTLPYWYGSLVAVIIVVLWPVTAQFGIADMWNAMANIRWPIVFGVIVIVVIYDLWLRMGRKNSQQ